MQHYRRYIHLSAVLQALCFGAFFHGSLAQAQAPVRVGIIGDQTLVATNVSDAYEILKAGVTILNKLSVATVLHTGDLIESSYTESEIRKNFQQATDILSGLKTKWHMAVGDHDVSPPYAPNSSDRSKESLFLKLYQEKDTAASGLYYSFDVQGYHFVSIYTEEQLDTDPRWGDVFLAQISDPQYKWLKADLESHRQSNGVVVFMHQPLWYNWTGWSHIHELLKSYRVIAVVAGHFHYPQDSGTLDGIRYITIGATGGKIKDSDPKSGGLPHITVMTLDRGKAMFNLLSVPDEKTVALTPHEDMDRIQALDLVLGGLYSFKDDNYLCAKDGRLYGDTAATKSPTLQLIPIGNPIDVPLDMSVTLDAPALQLQDNQYMPDGCGATDHCTLPAGARIESSNNSSIVLNNRFTPLPPLWQATIKMRDSSTQPPIDVNLEVKLSFQTKGTIRWIKGNAKATVVACQ